MTHIRLFDERNYRCSLLPSIFSQLSFYPFYFNVLTGGILLASSSSQSGNPLARSIDQLGVMASIFMQLHQILKR
jgi:hypothetical protein